MKELKNDMKTKKFKTCYLLYGKESYLKNSYESNMKKAMIDKESEIMNYDVYEDKKMSVGRVIDSLETMPFLSEKRLVVIRNSGLFVQGRKDDSEKMAEYLPKVPESSCVIFVEEDIDKRGKLYKSAVKNGYAVEFKTPDEKTLLNWIVSEFKKSKMTIDKETSIYLLRMVGDDMGNIIREILKLAAYKGEENLVTKEDIDAVCIKSFETKIFDLVAAIGNKKPEIALEIYRNMLLMKESPIMVLAMITRQFRLILQCKYLLKEGGNGTNISQRLGQRDFVIRECVKQSNNFSLEILRKAVDDCLETDISIKTGKMNGDMAVELLIIMYGKRAVSVSI